MSFTLTGTNLDAPDAAALADFYRRLLGWNVKTDTPDWVVLQSPSSGHTLNFQTETHYVRPVWPAAPGNPPMMMHLEIRVDDLETAVTQAVGLGANVAEFQPQEDVRVCLDPAGHPFCLYTGT
jgi:catechol 2,3-dioxygenase-like lactoylglutathione lyase family enzyme